MSKNIKLIPELRFPEFENDGEWVGKKLSSISKIVMGSSPSSSSYNESGSGLPLLQGNADIKNRLSVPRIYTTEITKVCEIHDILLSVRAPVGTVAKSLHNACIGRGISALRTLKPNSQEYLYQWLFSYESSWQKVSQGGTFDAVNSDDIKSILVPSPKPQEQQKIASCLSSLDELITAANQKLGALKAHKKGLMQNLFPQSSLNHDSKGLNDSPDYSKVPKYRFPEFIKKSSNQENQTNQGSDNGEWVDKKLGDVYSFLVTNSFSRELLNYENGTVNNIYYGDIHTKFSTLFDITNEYVPFINPEVPIDRIREECYCIEGDIIFADASEDLNDVGKSIEIFNLNGQKLLSGLHTLMARQIDKKLEIGFGGYLFKSEWIRKQIQREAQGAKVLGISVGRISTIKISYPKNPKEQKKIASCLSSLDALITVQTEKIEQLQWHKKGLMQGLFPKLSEL